MVIGFRRVEKIFVVISIEGKDKDVILSLVKVGFVIIIFLEIR